MRRVVIATALLIAACNANESADNTMNVDNLATDNLVVENGSAPTKVECDVIGERVTQEECDDIRALDRDVRTGAAALDVPDPMTRGRKSQVTLVIDRRPLEEIRRAERPTPDTADMNAADSNAVDMNAVDTIEPEPADNASVNAVDSTTGAEDEPAVATPNQVVAELPGTDYSFPSEVGRYMTATLAGQGFDIRLISPDDPVQEVPAGGQATWIWEVVPTEEGVRTLTARTQAVAVVGGRTKPLGNGQTSKTVTVDVRTMDRARDFLTALPDWLKLIAGVLAAAALVVAAWLKLRNAGRGTPG